MVLRARICVCLEHKLGEGVMGKSQKIVISLFSRDLADHAPQQAAWALQWALDRLWVHTQVQADNAHFTDEIETGVGADGLVHDTSMHTTQRYVKQGSWAGEKWNMTAYVMPDCGQNG